jgi:hypothetical protein
MGTIFFGHVVLGGSVYTIKKSTEALVAVSHEVALEINADKTKYMLMPRDQNAGQNHNIMYDKKLFERVGQFEYLATPLRKQNSIQEEIKCRTKSGNACYPKL